MEIYIAKKILEETVNECLLMFPEELSAKVTYSYENDKFEPCEYESANLGFINAEIELCPEGIDTQNMLIFETFVACHDGLAEDEGELNLALTDFREEIDTFLCEYEGSEDKRDFIENEVRNKIGAQHLMAERLEREMRKFRLTAFIAVAVGVLGLVVAAILSNIL